MGELVDQAQRDAQQMIDAAEEQAAKHADEAQVEAQRVRGEIGDKMRSDMEKEQMRSHDAESNADAKIDEVREQTRQHADANLERAQKDNADSELAAQEAIQKAQKVAAEIKDQADAESRRS